MSDDLSLDARLLRFRSDPGAEPCHELSAALLDAQRAREALEVLSRGLSLREDDVRLLRLAARAFLVEGDVLRAQQTLTRVIRSHPADVEAYRLLAETLLQRGDLGRAQAAVAKALSLAPEDDGLRALRERVGKGAGAALATEPVAAPVPVPVPVPVPAPQPVAASQPAPAAEVESQRVVATGGNGGPLSVAGAVADAEAQAVADADALGEREELAQDVTRLLAQAMKTASTPPPPMDGPAPVADETRPSARPQPSPGLAVAPLPTRAGSVAPTRAVTPTVAPATVAPAAVAPAAAPAAVTPAAVAPGAVTPAAPASPPATGAPPVGAPPAGRPGPRRSPTLMGFAPPRPPARPASVPPPARSAPLPAIRPPSVRPPGTTGVVPPPNFAPPAMPLPPVAAPEPAPPPLASTPPLAAPAAPPVRPASAPEQEEEDEPTSFMDRESLAGALGVPVSRRESKRPAPAATVSVGGAVPTTPVAGRAPAVPLPDTLPEFVVPNLPDAPPADGPKRGDALRVPPRPADASAGDQRTGTPQSAPNDGSEAAPVAAAPRARRSGRAGVLLLLALVVTLGGGFAAHRAGVLPPAWSSVIDQRWDALVGGPGAPEPAIEPTPPVVLDAAAEPPAPEVDPATARIAELDAALAEGRVPLDLPEDAQPESLRLRAEAALLSATPWWSLGATPEDQAALEPIAAELTAAIDTQPAHAVALRATAIRVAAARGETDALGDARALAAEHPDDARVRWALAEALIAAGEVQEADALLAALVDAGPEPMRARAAVQRAWLAAGRGDHVTARTALDAARALAPAWELVLLRSMDLRLDAGEYRAVLAELGDPGDSEARVLRALRAQLGLEQLEASEALWASLSEETRQRPQVQPLAAQYFMARGEPGEAVRALADLALAEPGDPTLIALYASALYEAGQTLVASAQFERAIALDEGHPEALIGFAQVLLRARKYREARINLDRAEAGLRGRLRPPATLARLRVMRARIMVEERELAQAAVLLRRTLEIEGAPSEGWFYLGEALARSNSPEARAAYERYLSLSPVGPLASRARRAIQ